MAEVRMKEHRSIAGIARLVRDSRSSVQRAWRVIFATGI
jgi:hypothetical protein